MEDEKKEGQRVGKKYEKDGWREGKVANMRISRKTGGNKYERKS